MHKQTNVTITVPAHKNKPAYETRAQCIVRYDSLGELVRDAVTGSAKHYKESGNGFHGDTKKAIAKAATGATEAELKSTRELIDKVDAAFRDREAVNWVASVAGAYPVVPDMLNGAPDCMRLRASVEDDRAPVRLFVGVLVSAGVPEENLRKRGAALAALAMRLSEIRPVEMYAYWAVSCHGTNGYPGAMMSVRIGTAPVSAAEVAFMSADKLFVRNLAFMACYNHANDGVNDEYIAWGWGAPSKDEASDHLRSVRAVLGCTDADVVLPGGFLDQRDEMLIDPVGWVNKYLQSQRELD